MKQIHHTLPFPNNIYTNTYFPLDAVFFDIETTGFSAKNSMIYLIGLLKRTADTLEIYQLFAENTQDEPDILDAFYALTASSKVFIGFNINGFDIPFLKERQCKFQREFDWNSYQYIDLYKQIFPVTDILSLPNKKQKTLETFLGIFREDKYNGGELIQIYHNYIKNPADDAKEVLLLHNYEDILGMIKLLPLPSYPEVLKKEPKISSSVLEESKDFDTNETRKELHITIAAELPFPKQVIYEHAFFRMVFRENCLHLFIPVYEGELRFYYENYKDYYYLPDEDMAIHKSVAAFVDKSHRKKATAATCYTKRTGKFLPQSKNCFSPVFSFDKKDKINYFEYSDDFLENVDALTCYAKHILSSC